MKEPCYKHLTSHFLFGQHFTQQTVKCFIRDISSRDLIVMSLARCSTLSNLLKHLVRNFHDHLMCVKPVSIG